MTAWTSYRTLISEAADDPRTLVRVERSGAVATETMDDAAKYNVLSAALTWQLHAALRDLAADPEVRAVILTGADPAFSAGGDVRLMTRAQDVLAGGVARFLGRACVLVRGAGGGGPMVSVGCARHSHGTPHTFSPPRALLTRSLDGHHPPTTTRAGTGFSTERENGRPADAGRP